MSRYLNSFLRSEKAKKATGTENYLNATISKAQISTHKDTSHQSDSEVVRTRHDTPER